jgi:hypothetical protein
MTQRHIGRITAAVALLAVLAFAAPAGAASWSSGPTSGWLDAAVQWIAGVWIGAEPTAPAEKRVGADSANATVTPPPPAADSGHGIDPNG